MNFSHHNKLNEQDLPFITFVRIANLSIRSVLSNTGSK